MTQQFGDGALDRLGALVGEWRMLAEFEGAPPAEDGARVVFEWMPGQRFLVERWEIALPSDDGRTISGAWEKCLDGATWERDFALTYSKLSSPRGPRLPHG